MASLKNLLPFLHATNPVSFKFFRACMKALFHLPKPLRLKVRFPAALAFLDTTFPRLFFIKSFLVCPVVFTFWRVPRKTWARVPRMEVRRARRRRTTRRLRVVRLFLETLRRVVRRRRVVLRELRRAAIVVRSAFSKRKEKVC